MGKRLLERAVSFSLDVEITYDLINAINTAFYVWALLKINTLIFNTFNQHTWGV